MNFTACIKSARIKPNYILNVSIDIPLKSKKIFSDRSHLGHFTLSPTAIQPNKKIKVSLGSTSLPKTTKNTESRKISSCVGEDTQNTVVGTQKRRTIQSINSYNKKLKNKSCEVSPKPKFQPKEKKKKSTLSNNHTKRSKLMGISSLSNDSEDNMIKYTYESSELKKDLFRGGKQIQLNYQQIQHINFNQIRHYQKIATEKKEHLNYEYLKEKALILASVRKIQRAWRSYRTKRLLKSYSTNFNIRLKSKIQLPSNILTVKSEGTAFKKHKEELGHRDKKKSKEEALKKFQLQQIKKWQQLINQLRAGKKVEEVLENSFKRKTELQKDLQIYQENQPQQSTQERRKKLQYFQSQIRKIDNESQSINQFQYIDIDSKSNEQIENQNLKKKLLLFNQLELNDTQYIEDKLKSSSEEELQTSRIQSQIRVLEQEQTDKNPIQYQSMLIQPKTYSQPQLQLLVPLILEEIIYQMLIDFAQSTAILKKMKQFHTLKNDIKPEGICTNLQSIKDYLENLVSYVFQKYPNLFKQRLMEQTSPTPMMLFKYIRDEPIAQSPYQQILTDRLFEEHWEYASEQIYFDVKFQNPEKQKNRVKYLKNLTRIYFRAIFDGFNECLEPYRVYGLAGKPYPWKIQPLTIKIPQPKEVVRRAYKKLSKLAMVFCGMFLQNRKGTMPPQVIKQIQNERMNTFMEMEIEGEEYRWETFDDYEAQVWTLVGELLFMDLVDELAQL